MITVYIDVLISLNIIITYIFLVCVRVFLKMPTSKPGVAFSSLLGGLSSLLIYFDTINPVLLIIIKILLSAVLVFVAFIPKTFKLFLKQLLSFMGITFLFGGAMFCLELVLHPKNILFINGTVYFNMDIKYLVASVFSIYGVFLIFDYLLAKINEKKEIYKVKLIFRNTEIVADGLLDTGNSLQDGITGRAVAVGEIKALAPLFTYEETEFFKSFSYDNIPATLKGKIRLIPCKTVGDETMLPGFVPDYTSLNGKEIPKICVAVTSKNLSNGEYNILLNKNMLE